MFESRLCDGTNRAICTSLGAGVVGWQNGSDRSDYRADLLIKLLCLLILAQVLECRASGGIRVNFHVAAWNGLIVDGVFAGEGDAGVSVEVGVVVRGRIGDWAYLAGLVDVECRVRRGKVGVGCADYRADVCKGGHCGIVGVGIGVGIGSRC